MLYLADGAENLQNIPLLPLLQPGRNMDIIIADDNSLDTGSGWGICCGNNWPNGTSLNATYLYAKSPKGQNQRIAMPLIPTMDVFMKKRLNYRPTFFGCNSQESTLPGVKPPLIVYLANAPYTAWSNGTTYSTIVSTHTFTPRFCLQPFLTIML
jgi:lysophospholipase